MSEVRNEIMEDHSNVLYRLRRLEDSEKDVHESLKQLVIHTTQLSMTMEVLAETVSKQSIANEKIQKLSERLSKTESVLNIVKFIGGAVTTVAVGMILMYLFGTSPAEMLPT